MYPEMDVTVILYAVTAPVAANIARGQVARYLSQPELRRYGSLAERSALDFLAGRVALKAALRRCRSLPVRDLAGLGVGNGPNGQPRLVGHPGLHCSLAHSAGWGVGAVAAAPIGIDIERVRPHSVDLLRLIADDAELAEAGDGGGDDALLVARIWTLKEAVLKGMGVGLAVPPRQVKLRKTEGDAFFVEVLSHAAAGGSPWRAWTYSVDDVCISVATQEETRERPRLGWYQPPGLPAAGNALFAGRT
jgi:phosphopantetheinyl transferase